TIFTEQYPYYSSFSDAVVAHWHRHADTLIAIRDLGPGSMVVEVGSNDGYLLKRFQDRGVSVLGIDPSPGPAAAAQAIGVPTVVKFFGREIARDLRAEGIRPDVVIANNVMAHVPELNDFVAGLATLVDDAGIVAVENPNVVDLVVNRAFDTIYHEHCCYFSTIAVKSLFERHGLHLSRVESFPDYHGGTLRWTASRNARADESVAARLAYERRLGADQPEFYASFAREVFAIQNQLACLLVDLRLRGKRVAAYGAAAKGVTLLSSAHITNQLLSYVCDRNTHKQGKLLPGIRIPIVDPSRLLTDRPDFVLILAWNVADEVMAQLSDYRSLGGRFILPLPRPHVAA
ncbi:MAG: methyltransferase domain-containing protein, partial [Vicinamibacterales bacterium]